MINLPRPACVLMATFLYLVSVEQGFADDVVSLKQNPLWCPPYGSNMPPDRLTVAFHRGKTRWLGTFGCQFRGLSCTRGFAPLQTRQHFRHHLWSQWLTRSGLEGTVRSLPMGLAIPCSRRTVRSCGQSNLQV